MERKAVQLLEMMGPGCELDAHTCISVLGAKGGDVEAALEALIEMTGGGGGGGRGRGTGDRSISASQSVQQRGTFGSAEELHLATQSDPVLPTAASSGSLTHVDVQEQARLWAEAQEQARMWAETQEQARLWAEAQQGLVPEASCVPDSLDTDAAGNSPTDTSGDEAFARSLASGLQDQGSTLPEQLPPSAALLGAADASAAFDGDDDNKV